MKAKIIEGSVFDVLPTITPGSVDCVVCSPPYFALRDYSGCPCVKRGADGRSRKRPGCTNCDDNGKVPHVRDNQLGMEPDPDTYVRRMVEVFRLVREVLSPWGTVWCNIGDSYSGSKSHSDDGMPALAARCRGGSKTLHEIVKPDRKPPPGIPAGNLCLVPQRLALALQADGWICRSVIVWQKPSPMPASLAGWRWTRCRVKVKGTGWNNETHPSRSGIAGDISHSGGVDVGKRVGNAQWEDCPGCPRCEPNNGLVLRRGSWRCTSSWEPVLMLAKQSGYFSDGEAVKQPAMNTGGNGAWGPRGDGVRNPGERDDLCTAVQSYAAANLRDVWRTSLADLTREELIDLIEQQADNNLPDLWTISSEPLHEKHYASFPSRLVELCLRAGTSAKGYCPVCGMPVCRVVKTKNMVINRSDWAEGSGNRTASSGTMVEPAECETIGWRPSCSHHDQEPRPALCLDPFAGSGRTGIVARKLGLDFVGIELAPGYVAMARRLLSGDMPLFDDLPDTPEDDHQQGDLFSNLPSP